MTNYPLGLARVILLLSAWQGNSRLAGKKHADLPFQKWLHLECPGCLGLQRSVIATFALLKGMFRRAFNSIRPVPLFFVLLGFFVLHLKYDFSNGAVIIKYLQGCVAIIILTIYIYKIVNHKLVV